MDTVVNVGDQFDGVYFSVRPLLALHDFAKGTLTQDGAKLVVLRYGLPKLGILFELFALHMRFCKIKLIVYNF